MQISEKTKQELLSRAGRRCECHSDKCRHHLPGARCKNGLRGTQWKPMIRAEGSGEALWNLTAMCDRCARNH